VKVLAREMRRHPSTVRDLLSAAATLRRCCSTPPGGWHRWMPGWPARRISMRSERRSLGIEARSRALVSEGQAAEDLYREAIERLARTRIAVHRARAELLYGEWLRRENRRLDARGQLRRAYEMFSRIGADAFAERARHELLATGETVRKRTVETLEELTAQEAQIARLARDGQTNPEIGARLFISPRTVEWHLRNVFSKLEISSRKELRRVLPDTGRAGIPA
jgi:DNA-binding CsgD family transcriptional regulator